MGWNDFGMRLRALFSRRRVESELDEELSFHLAMEAEKNRARGLGAAEAGRVARREFGGVEHFREECRDARGLNAIENLWRDVRYGIRVLGRTPVFTAVAMASLAIGIGANTAVFSLVDTVLLRNLPVRHADELVVLGWSANNAPRSLSSSYSNSGGGGAYGRWHTNVFSWPMFESARRSGVLAEAIGYSQLPRLNVMANGESRVTGGMAVTGNYFSGLGVRMALGRPLVADDDSEGGATAAVISYRLWERVFGLDPAAAGKTIYINRTPYVVVGVTAREFFGVSVTGMFLAPEIDVTLPIQLKERIDGAPDRGSEWRSVDLCWVQMMGRLKPGSGPGAVAAQLWPLVAANLPEAAARQVRGEAPRVDAQSGSHGLGYARTQFQNPLKVLAAVVGLALLMACANLAGLLLARAAARRREITIRLAVGAGRWRLVRQLLMESALLSAGGAAAGLLVGRWGLQLLLAMVRVGQFALPVEVHLDPRVLGFAAAVSMLTTVLFGLAPALRATRVDLAHGLKEDTPLRAAKGRIGGTQMLVALQIAVALLLTVGATLAVRSLANLRAIPLGFNATRVVTFGLDAGRNGYDEARSTALYTRLLEEFNRTPGVVAAGGSTSTPMSGYSSNTAISVEGGHRGAPKVNGISERFLDLFQIPLVAGRGLEARDMSGARVAVINESMMRRYFGGGPAIGRSFRWERKGGWDVQVVGIVKDAKYDRLRDDPPATIYVPWTQMPWGAARQLDFEVRTAGDANAAMAAVRRVVRDADRMLPVMDIKSMEQMIDEALEQERLLAWLVGLFGAITLVLASVGLYGMVAYSVTGRTREIGLRMALGADRGAVLGMILRQVLLTAGGGIAIGLAAALGATRVVRSLLYGVKANDATSFLAAAGMVLAVAVLAVAVPARRAMAVDPVRALRYE
ncbi:MAG: ABC transporter permease [Candidatus Solibacter sp.]|jgi:predicted permease